MKINTKSLGEIEAEENEIINFQEGLPGFEELKKYVLISDETEGSPFCWLQSTEDENIAFTMIDIFRFMPSYNPCVEDETVKDIVDKNEKNLDIYNIVVIPEEFEKMTVNLKAPVIINTGSKRGKQVISSNEEYPIKYYIYEELKKLKEGV